jgi:hypothetical protein
LLIFPLTHSSTCRILGIAPRNSTVEGYYLTVGIHNSPVSPYNSTEKQENSTVGTPDSPVPLIFSNKTKKTTGNIVCLDSSLQNRFLVLTG